MRGTQTPASEPEAQQPSRHETASQLPPRHTPLLHEEPKPQAPQRWPPKPQAVALCIERATQTPFWQQPVGQVVGLHWLVVVQVPSRQAAPTGQLVQTSPKWPQV